MICLIALYVKINLLSGKAYFGPKTCHSRCNTSSQNPYWNVADATCQVRIRTETLLDISRLESSGRCCLSPFRTSQDDDPLEVSSHPSRVNGYVEPTCNRPSYNSIKAHDRHPARVSQKINNQTHNWLACRRGQSQETPDESHFWRKTTTREPRASQPDDRHPTRKGELPTSPKIDKRR